MRSMYASISSSSIRPLLVLGNNSSSGTLSSINSATSHRHQRYFFNPCQGDCLFLASNFSSSQSRRLFYSSAPCSSSTPEGLHLLPGNLQTSSTLLVLRFFAPSRGAGLAGKQKKKRSSCRISKMSMSGAQDPAPADMSRTVKIVNTSGEKLAGVIDDTKSKELVVLCHGFRSSKDSNTLGAIAASILKTGISTFRFDFAGNGESEGQFSYGNYWRETEDLRSVILHWRAEGRQVTAILGHSKGGNVVVLYASKYGDVSIVVNISGRFALDIGPEARFGKKGMTKLQEEGFLDVKSLSGFVEYRVTLKGLEDRLATDMDAAARSISKGVRVLTIHGAVDETVAVEDALEFAKRIPNHMLGIIDRGNHIFEGTQKELSTLVLEFLQDKLSKM